MDPLSVSASIAGLLTLGGKLTVLLTQISRLPEAPPMCKAVLTEVCDTASALRQVQTFLDEQLQQVPADRKRLVLLEHVATTLTGCVMTKDELETELDDLGLVYAADLGSITGVFDRLRWVRKEPSLDKLVRRLQNHKASISLILTVLQCTSTTQLQDSVDRLHGLIGEALSANSLLAMRIDRLEGSSTLKFDADSVVVGRAQGSEGGGKCSVLDNDNRDGDNDNSSVTSVKTVQRVSTHSPAPSDLYWGEVGELRYSQYTFDVELQNSKVYRKVMRLRTSDAGVHSETSVTTSVRRKAAASVFSHLSLADVSYVSLYSLPISVDEISNNQWYGQIGGRLGGDHNPARFRKSATVRNPVVVHLHNKRSDERYAPSPTYSPHKEIRHT